MQGDLISGVISLVNACLSLSDEGLDLHESTQTRLYATSSRARDGKQELAWQKDKI